MKNSLGDLWFCLSILKNLCMMSMSFSLMLMCMWMVVFFLLIFNPHYNSLEVLLGSRWFVIRML